jgi:hypothetical protein
MDSERSSIDLDLSRQGSEEIKMECMVGIEHGNR